MTDDLDRRAFTRRKFGLFAAGGALALPTIVRGRNLNDRISIAMIGVGGRGGANLSGVAKERIAALCDVNAVAVDAAARRFPDAARTDDFRRLFDKPGAFDAVVVSTCEHTHFHAVMLALRHDKHVYCEKPLSHDVWEARQIRLEAAKRKVATQMGIQIHAQDNYRQAVEIVRSGAIGAVREAHVWVGRAWGLQSAEAAKRNRDIVHVTERPRESEPIPKGLNWDLWIGPAPMRPFHSVYVPGPKWYRWWEFGNGTMSDLGSHWNDLPFWALDLDAPISIEASGPPAHPEIAPATMTARYEFPAKGDRPALSLTWHQGEAKPEIWRSGGIPKWDSGVLFVGDRGMMLADYAKRLMLPEKDFKDYAPPTPTIPRSKGHYAEWLDACRGGAPAMANFQYAGLLTESNHLGNVAHRAGKKLLWDSAALKATNAPEADRFLRKEYRKGWEI
jgi:predicted dehydrogenase